MSPSFTMFKNPIKAKKGIDVLHPLTEWFNPPKFDNWKFLYRQSYGINHLKRIRRSLGLSFIRAGTTISKCFIGHAFADRGLRTLINSNIVTALVRVETLLFLVA